MGKVLEEIATEQTYLAAAAKWQAGGDRGGVVVVVPELAYQQREHCIIV